MMEKRQLQWDTIHRSEGDNIVIDFDIRPRHIALIPFEVLEDELQTSEEEPLASARENRILVEAAISRAVAENDWRELVNLATGQKLFQLWIKRSHFQELT